MNTKVDIVRKWIEKADHDLGTAILTFRHIPTFRDTIAFHCQQASEKYLKSYLIFLGIEFRKYHDLIYLAELINQKEQIDDNTISKLAELEGYAVEIRYPDIEIELTDNEIQNAISISKEIRTYVTMKMNLQIDYEDMVK
jgi:HEPN domain-containing protein